MQTLIECDIREALDLLSKADLTTPEGQREAQGYQIGIGVLNKTKDLPLRLYNALKEAKQNTEEIENANTA